MEKRHLDRRLEQMRAEGTRFRAGVDVGVDITGAELRDRYDAVVLAVGATACARPAGARAASSPASTRRWSTCRWPTACSRATWPRARSTRRGQARRHHRRRRHRRRLPGHRAPAGRRVGHPAGDPAAAADERPRRPAVADLPDGLAHVERPRGGRRAGLRGEHAPVPRRRAPARCARSSWSRCEQVDGRFVEVPGTEREIPARPGAARDGLRRAGDRRPGRAARASTLDGRGTVGRDASYATTADGVFVAGDAGRGQSLIVWAIAEGRACAAGVDRWLVRVDQPARADPRRPRDRLPSEPPNALG